jgi:hypothetical protein
MSQSGKASGPAPAAHSVPAQPDLLHQWSLRLEDAEEAPVPGGWRKVALMAAIAGIGFTILYVIAFLLLAQVPMGHATDEEILTYYGDGTNLTLSLAGMLVMPFAGIFFLYFMVMLRSAARATGIRVSRVLGNIQFATGILFVGMLFVATAGLIATPAGIRLAGTTADPVVARMLPTLSMAVLLMFGMRMASMFVFVSSSIGRASGLIPSWFAWAGYAVGVLLLLAFTLEPWFALLFAVWVLLLCVIIAWRYQQSAPRA